LNARWWNATPNAAGRELGAAPYANVTLEFAGYFNQSRGDTEEIMWPLLAQVVRSPEG
jgi:hypothetical protein